MPRIAGPETAAKENLSHFSVEQAGALCWRKHPQTGEIELLLVASLSTGGWGIPKGHIEDSETSRDAAIREAFEEAGVIGEPTKDPVATFSYCKAYSSTELHVSVYAIHVAAIASDYPEKDLRLSRWVSAASAAGEVERTALRVLLSELYK